jgi:copper chaperone
MISFKVDDMTCGHCVSTITKALKGVDATAKVQVDLATHRVHIEPVQAHATQLREAIEEAGFTPVLTESPAGGL